jgi:hypothetical protein
MRLGRSPLLVSAIVFVGVISGVLLFYPRPRHPINPTSYQQIHLGMSFDEVKSVLGEPGVYMSERQQLKVAVLTVRSSIHDPLPGVSEGLSEAKVQRDEEWYGPSGAITVGLDGRSRVVRKRFQPFPQRSVLERLKEWLPWEN